MNVLNFLMTYGIDIGIIIAIIAIIIYAIYKKDLTIVRKQLFALVTEAEALYGAGTGELKLASVIDAIYPNLPKLFKTFVTGKQLTKIVEGVLAEAKEKWNSNKNLEKIIKEESKEE